MGKKKTVEMQVLMLVNALNELMRRAQEGAEGPGPIVLCILFVLIPELPVRLFVLLPLQYNGI